MPNVFEVTDPRGWLVICTEDCFKNHIVTHHSIMEDCEEEVKQAIEAPVIGIIYCDAHNVNRNIYYRKRKSGYLKVVVQFDENGLGEVITAFPVSYPKSGEKIIWPD
ncbi:MAG: hypothetical protein K8L97_22330 [Anaerolineae bacterium]|nr:hypothetical protein [Anaerolineae bacterium]